MTALRRTVGNRFWLIENRSLVELEGPISSSPPLPGGMLERILAGGILALMRRLQRPRIAMGRVPETPPGVTCVSSWRAFVAPFRLVHPGRGVIFGSRVLRPVAPPGTRRSSVRSLPAFERVRICPSARMSQVCPCAGAAAGGGSARWRVRRSLPLRWSCSGSSSGRSSPARSPGPSPMPASASSVSRLASPR